MEVVFDTYKEGGKIVFFGQLFRTNVVFKAMKSYNQRNLLDLVTMATTKIV